MTADESDSATLVEMLAMEGGEEIEFEPPRLSGPFMRPADLS